MKDYAVIFLRAFVIVSLTAANVALISRGQYLAAFGTGGGISAVWWFNAKTAARSDLRGGWIAYSLGAACGTIFGMWCGR